MNQARTCVWSPNRSYSTTERHSQTKSKRSFIESPITWFPNLRPRGTAKEVGRYAKIVFPDRIKSHQVRSKKLRRMTWSSQNLKDKGFIVVWSLYLYIWSSPAAESATDVAASPKTLASWALLTRFGTSWEALTPILARKGWQGTSCSVFDVSLLLKSWRHCFARQGKMSSRLQGPTWSWKLLTIYLLHKKLHFPFLPVTVFSEIRIFWNFLERDQTTLIKTAQQF